MSKMEDKYERLLASGEYDSVDEMCNDLCLNYSDLYEDEDEDD